MRRFAGLRLSDETTILDFRHFLERHEFGQRLFDTIQSHLASQGSKLHEGKSIVDATIIAAPTSTKNQAGKRKLYGNFAQYYIFFRAALEVHACPLY